MPDDQKTLIDTELTINEETIADYTILTCIAKSVGLIGKATVTVPSGLSDMEKRLTMDTLKDKALKRLNEVTERNDYD